MRLTAESKLSLGMHASFALHLNQVQVSGSLRFSAETKHAQDLKKKSRARACGDVRL
jgi:hypothetical protein